LNLELTQRWACQSDAVASVVKNGSCDYKAIYNKFGQKGLSEYFGELKKYFVEFQVKAYQQSIDTNKNIAYRAWDYANNKVGEIKYARAVQCAMRSANSETPIPGIFEITDALSQPSGNPCVIRVIDEASLREQGA
jgi:hypothetical protein